MHQEKEILDILGRCFTGEASEEEMHRLEGWMQDPDHKAMVEKFMARRDMHSVYSLPKCHSTHGSPFADSHSADGSTSADAAEEDGIQRKGRMLWLKVAGVAAVAVFAFLVGRQWWDDYTRVVEPSLDSVTLNAMHAAQLKGYADADVTLHAKDDAGMHIAGRVADDKGLDSLYRAANAGDGMTMSADDMYADIVTYHDKEFWMTLPDGTRVHLNYNSSLTYPLAFTGRAREVVLEGEAYFFVAKDNRHPFIVHTKYGDVKEYGTEFDVSTRYDSQNSPGAYGIRGKGLAVVLVNGSISVIPHDRNEYMMKPGDLAVVRAGSGKPSIRQVDTTPFTSWNTGTFAFSDCPLDKLMDVVGRWHGKTVLFTDDSYRKIHFNGEIDRYETLDNIISVLKKSTGTKIVVRDETIEVGR